MSNFMNYINTLFLNETFQVIFKLVLVTLLTGIIGYEREHSSKPAGFRTHVLVGISSVLVMLCGTAISKEYGNNDPSRMPAQLLSGIGFIGAGTILSNGFKVKGLTTASGLLAVTCIGLTVGAGMYTYAIIATIIVYVVLKYSFILNSNLDHISEVKLKIVTDMPKNVIDPVEKIMQKYDININNLKIIDDEDNESEYNYALYDLKILNSSFSKNALFSELARIDKVKQVVEIEK